MLTTFERERIYVSPRHIHVLNNLVKIDYWKYDREELKDKIVLIVGGGPSHVEMDLKLLDNISIFAVNSSCRKVETIAKKEDILYFSDNAWSENFENLIKSWPGRVVTSNRNSKARLGELINRLDLGTVTEFMQTRPDFSQASSGHTAACLAVHMGAKKIILIGFEAGIVNGRSHGHDDYQQMETNAYEERFVPGWRNLKVRFDELDVKIINSTPNSKILDFEFKPLEEAIKYYA